MTKPWVNDEKCSRSHVTMMDMAWTHMRHYVGCLELPPDWVRQYTPTALITHNRKRTVYVKITTAGEVFVDRKQRDNSYKSERFHDPHVEDAAIRTRDILIAEAAIKHRVFE